MGAVSDLGSTKLTVRDLSELLGIKDDTVRTWQRNGLPSTKRTVGKCRRVVFDRGQITQWLLNNNKPEYAYTLNQNGGTDEPSLPSSTLSGKTQPAGTSLAEMAEHVHQQEQFCYEKLEQCKADADEGGIRVWFDRHQQAAEQRRKIDKDRAAIELSMGDVLPREQVDEELRQMAVEIKSKLLAIPNSAAPRLEGKDAAWIAGELKRVIEDALTALAEGE